MARLDFLKKMKMPEKPEAAKEADMDLEALDMHDDSEPEMENEEGKSDDSDMMDGEESPKEEMKELEMIPDDMLIEEVKKRGLKVK